MLLQCHSEQNESIKGPSFKTDSIDRKKNHNLKARRILLIILTDSFFQSWQKYRKILLRKIADFSKFIWHNGFYLKKPWIIIINYTSLQPFWLTYRSIDLRIYFSLLIPKITLEIFSIAAFLDLFWRF